MPPAALRKFTSSLALLTLLVAASGPAQGQAPQQQLQDVQKRLEQEMERWEELSLQAEEQEER